ncbi:Yos1-like protein [Phyllosticta citriasiana]|uniref:Yos1-like protein n=1 Tax=Phyllosticta citriasiana TaxID=595635 RepID=A0ABR1KUD4_9PEZI
MLFFGLGGLFYVVILLTNAIAVLSEDRFLARNCAIARHLFKTSQLTLPKSLLTRILVVGWGLQAEPAFGGVQDTTSVKAKMIHLIASVRTLMRGPLIVVNTLIILYEIILG